MDANVTRAINNGIVSFNPRARDGREVYRDDGSVYFLCVSIHAPVMDANYKAAG